MADRGRFARLKVWASALKRDVVALSLAARDPRVPIGAKIVAAAVAAYALSPIDLIPDFIPVLGLVDDLLIVPAGIWLAVRMIPKELLDEHREQAAIETRPVSQVGLVVVFLCWIALGYGIVALLR